MEKPAEFDTALQEAIKRMNLLTRSFPDDPMLLSIYRQLQSVSTWMSENGKLTPEQKHKLSFGLMASRSVDELDQDLAQLLYALANYLDRLPSA